VGEQSRQGPGPSLTARLEGEYGGSALIVTDAQREALHTQDELVIAAMHLIMRQHPKLVTPE
jgi:hypothetical protein